MERPLLPSESSNSPDGDRRATLHERVQRLAAYVAASLVERILSTGVPVPGEARHLTGATLFTDITGFAPMSEKLATYGLRGAEELNRVLLQTFTAMINAIHRAGGYVLHFYGDAMSVYFPDHDGRAAERALACARFMQSLMQSSYRQVVTYRQGHLPTVFDLSLKIGVGYGRCQEILIGDPTVSTEFVVAGPAVDAASTAQFMARAGEIVASRAVLIRAGLAAPDDFSQVTEWLPMPDLGLEWRWETFPDRDLLRLEEALAAFVPPAVVERLSSSEPHLVAEHRPATSMFVRFSGINFEEENAGRLLQLYYEWARQVVDRYGGDNSRLNRVIVSDKGHYLHIMFGAPIAPDAPEQALRCAIALQRERPAFITGQHIGVVGGRVFAGPVGSQDRREYTIVGDVVNLSARLAQWAADGAVVTDESTAIRVRDAIELQELPPQPIKGKRHPVPIFQVAGSRATVTRLETRFSATSEPLIGYQAELDMMLGLMDATLRGVGGMVAITSPGSVEAARLLARGARHWLASGGAGYYGVGQPHTSDVPYSVWRNVWRDFFGLRSEMTVREQAVLIRERLVELEPAARDDAPLWGEALGVPMRQTARLAMLTAEARQARLFPLVRDALAAAARVQPLAVVLEDIQWADNLSLDLLDDMARHLGDLPLFIAVTYRSDNGFEPSALRRPNCLPIILSDLPAQEARLHVQSIVGESHLPLAVEQHLGLRDREGRSSAVNPLFLQESLKMMLERGVLQRNGRLRVNEELLSELPVPETVHSLLLARLDHLPSASRNLLHVGSVIGRQFDLDTLLAAAGLQREAALRILDELIAQDFLQVVTLQPVPTYIFQHAMIHEVVYGSLPFSRRHALHTAVAEFLIGRHQTNLRPFYPLLAYHYGRTEAHSRALQFALAAADDAFGVLAYQEAVDLYNIAETHLQQLSAGIHWGVQAHIYLARGNALRLLGEMGLAVSDVFKALTLAQSNADIEWSVVAYNLLAGLRYHQTQFREARELARAVLAFPPGRVPPDGLARSFMWAGMAGSALGDYEQAMADLRQAEALCEQSGNRQRLSRVLSAIAVIQFAQQAPDQALETVQRAVEMARHFGAPAQIGFALYHVAQAQIRLGQFEAALASLVEVIRLARGASRNLLAWGLTRWGEVLAYLGRFHEADVVFQEAANLFAVMDDERGLIEIYLLWAYESHCPRRQWVEARHTFTLAQKIIRGQPERFRTPLVRLLIGMAQVEIEDGLPSRAVRFLKKSQAIIDASNLTWWQTACDYWLGRARALEGDMSGARALWRRGREAALGQSCPEYLPLILLELARTTPTGPEREEYLAACRAAFERRARSHDREQGLVALEAIARSSS